jgi:hypothetical protein
MLAGTLYGRHQHNALRRHTQMGPASGRSAECRSIAAPLPQEVRVAGLVGPRLTALLAFQKGACQMSCTSIQTFVGGVL